jgi:hypothetical protein
MMEDTFASVSYKGLSCRARIVSVRSLSGSFAGTILLMLILIAPSASAQSNLLLNSDLGHGASMPDYWHPSRRTGCESFQWVRAKDAPSELKIVNAPGGDAAWTQTIAVPPGWYDLSAELQSQGARMGGAFLAITQGKSSASAFWSGEDWKRHDIYVRVFKSEPLEVQCGLTSPNLRTTVACRNISLAEIAAPPAGAQQFELAKQQPFSFVEAINWTTVWLIVLLSALGFIYCMFATVPTESGTAPISAVAGVSMSRAAVVAIFGVLLIGILALIRVKWTPGAGFSIVTPQAARSDEPHYILQINSLLFDHDFELQDDYDRVAAGGLEAGVRFQNVPLDRHTLLINKRTGHHAYASIDSPNSVAPCDPEFSSTDDVYEVSAHPPGFSMLVALAIAPFRPSLGDTESYAAVVLALITWLGALMTYIAGRGVGMSRAKAMLAVALLMGASSWLAYSRSFFPEATIGLGLIVALWALTTDRPVVAGLGVALAAMLKPPLAVVGIGFLINEYRAGRRQNALKLGLVMAICGAPVMVFNYWLAQTFVISGNSSWLRGASLKSIYDTFFEPGHALLYFIPWAIIAFVAIARAFRSDAPEAKLLRQMALPLILFLVLLSCSGTGPGLCYGPRYWVPFLPWFALATIQDLSRVRRPALVACGILVLIAALFAIPGALRYPDIFSKVPWAAWKTG